MIFTCFNKKITSRIDAFLRADGGWIKEVLIVVLESNHRSGKSMNTSSVCVCVGGVRVCPSFSKLTLKMCFAQSPITQKKPKAFFEVKIIGFIINTKQWLRMTRHKALTLVNAFIIINTTVLTMGSIFTENLFF